MPIAHQVQKLSDLLRKYEGGAFPMTCRKDNYYYFRKVEPNYKSTKRIVFKYNTYGDSTLIVLLKYQGRTDEINYYASTGTVEVRTKSVTYGYVREQTVIFPMCDTEEKMFQHSLVSDMMDSTVQDFQRIQVMYDMYFKICEERNETENA